MRLKRDETELAAIRAVSEGGDDRPVTMLNLNRYVPHAGYPDGALYRAYMDGLVAFLPKVGAKIIWRTPVFGRVVGDQVLHEILAAWYPSHRAFLDLPQAPGAEENYRLREECVEYAAIHRCAGDGYGLGPAE
jgi:hypothetical protein